MTPDSAARLQCFVMCARQTFQTLPVELIQRICLNI